MTKLLNSLPVATLIVAAAFLIVTIVGGIVTITNPESLSFDKYVVTVTGVAASAGLLGIGRGINSTAKPAVDSEGSAKAAPPVA